MCIITYRIIHFVSCCLYSGDLFSNPEEARERAFLSYQEQFRENILSLQSAVCAFRRNYSTKSNIVRSSANLTLRLNYSNSVVETSGKSPRPIHSDKYVHLGEVRRSGKVTPADFMPC
jgi:hypothetical protein